MKSIVIKDNKLQIQSILFNNKQDNILRSIDSLSRAVDFAIAEGLFRKVSLYYGDCSSIRVFSEDFLSSIKRKYCEYFSINYSFFGNNLGSARGHNSLAKDCITDYLMIINPDILLAPDTILQLCKPFIDNNIGIVEARQTPIEHPKEYNITTGETGWASTACVLFPNKLFVDLGGFDDSTFFLYCDDVDFSWRVRLAGYKVIFQPSAIVFHNKTLSLNACWIPSQSERYYSAEAGLLLAYKWSRPDILKNILEYFKGSREEHYQKAARAFEERRKKGELPHQIDVENKIGEFINGKYTNHRYDIEVK